MSRQAEGEKLDESEQHLVSDIIDPEKDMKKLLEEDTLSSPGRQEEGLMSLTDAVRPTTPKRDADAVGEDGWPTSAPSVVNLVGKPKTRAIRRGSVLQARHRTGTNRTEQD